MQQMLNQDGVITGHGVECLHLLLYQYYTVQKTSVAINQIGTPKTSEKAYYSKIMQNDFGSC